MLVIVRVIMRVAMVGIMGMPICLISMIDRMSMQVLLVGAVAVLC